MLIDLELKVEILTIYVKLLNHRKSFNQFAKGGSDKRKENSLKLTIFMYANYICTSTESLNYISCFFN